MTALRYRDTWERLWANSISMVGLGGTCVIWLGKQNANGYGHIQRRDGRKHPHSALVHIVAWELFHGRDVKPGRQIDHLCNNRLCWSLDHLEEVTAQENIIRMYARRRARLVEPAPLTAQEIEDDRALASILAGVV